MTIITGVQPNSGLHIGNFFGAILPMKMTFIGLEKGDKMFYFVPDLHTLSAPMDLAAHKNLYTQTLDNVRVLLSAGIDYQASNLRLFRQSRIQGHTDLSWILECYTHYGEASRMTQFKDKSTKQGESFSVGLFTYPILMASDILLFDADYVPVGEDQRQHLELCRDVAIRINNKFGKKVLNPPQPWVKQLEFFKLEEGLKIRSLSNPDKKMSKSDFDPKGTIYLTDKPDIAYKKIMSATTDSLEYVRFDLKSQPGISNLLQILACLRDQNILEVSSEFEGQTQYGPLKKVVAQELSNFLTNFQARYQDFSDQNIEDILQQHEKEVQSIASQKINSIKKELGFFK
jgi:tryptophanyl-tRNA synthetase